MGGENSAMKIPAGEEMSSDCPQPKPLHVVLRVHTP
jgi:hypothetical protein